MRATVASWVCPVYATATAGSLRVRVSRQHLKRINSQYLTHIQVPDLDTLVNSDVSQPTRPKAYNDALPVRIYDLLFMRANPCARATRSRWRRWVEGGSFVRHGCWRVGCK